MNQYVFIFRNIGNTNQTVTHWGYSAREALVSLYRKDTFKHLRYLKLDKTFLRQGHQLVPLQEQMTTA
jgi:hypothetical protein